ncbi:MAG TPA: D-alanine--D-alanine ligase family protein [Ktedonobacterales bacterium]|nr:D-alanine--D-alanine ligase family protein [Ktedonobacterales bacterium]
MPTARIAMIFGGRSVEHEVSVITAHQAMAALPRDRFTPVPVYIAKSGRWYTGDVLHDLNNFKDLDALTEQARPVVFSSDTARPGLLYEPTPQRARLFGGRAQEQLTEPIDVAFPLVHGSHGEDGTLQGLFELADLPYVGSGVAASAIGMDKRLTKSILRDAGLPVIDDIVVSRAQWQRDAEAVLTLIESRFEYPVFVKPCTLGSSIGVSRATDRATLTDAMDVAATYDLRLLVEPAQQDIIEVNCSVLGYGDDSKASTCEQPISEGVLSFADKYLPSADQGGAAKGGATSSFAKQGMRNTSGQPTKRGESQGMASARRLIPAPLDPALTQTVQQAAIRVFSALGAAGVARVDFFVRPQTGDYYVNEINTLPGSLAFYLWEHSGVAFPDLLTALIGFAQMRYREKRRITYTFASSLLSGKPFGGSKQVQA